MIWDSSFHADRRAPFRQFKFDFPGMKAEVFYLRQSAVLSLKGILFISHYSMPRMLAMHANLMGTPSLRHRFYQACALEMLPHREASQRGFAAFKHPNDALILPYGVFL